MPRPSETLSASTRDLSVTERTEVGTPEAPGQSQSLTFTTDINGVERRLVQFQVYLSMIDTEQPHERAVIELVLTATPDQINRVIGDFQDFVRSVRPPENEHTRPAPVQH